MIEIAWRSAVAAGTRTYEQVGRRLISITCAYNEGNIRKILLLFCNKYKSLLS